jgi:hypothetical protein
MHPQLEKRWKSLENRREVLVERVSALPEVRRNHRPPDGTFSPIELIQHFALAEAGNLEFMRKAPPKSLVGLNPKPTFFFHRTVESLRSPSKAVATLPSMKPKSPATLELAAERWAEVRVETGEFLEQVRDPHDAMVRFNIMFGLASASDYLDLLEAHTLYHEERFPKV